jgi:hypothetical protein
VACGDDGDSADARKPIDDFYASVESKDAAKAYNSISPECLTGFSQDAFTQAFNLGLSVLGDAKVTLESVEVTTDGDTGSADVQGKIEGGQFDGTEQDATDVALARSGDQWKIADCEFVQQFVRGGSGSPTATPTS